MARRSKLKIAGLGCSGFLLLIAIGIGILFIYSANALKSQMTASQKHGKILTVDDIMNEMVPPNENAAPIYAQAFSQISTLRSRTSGSKSPCEVMDAFISADKRRADPKLWDDVRPAAIKSKVAVDILEQASCKSKCRFPVNWQSGLMAQLPHLGNLRESTRILSAHAILAAKDGDMDRAVDLTCMDFRVCKSLQDEPSLISHLVMTAITSIASDSLKQVADLGNIDEANAKRLFDTLNTFDIKRSCRRGMEGERALGLQTFDLFRKHPETFATNGCAMGGISSNQMKAIGLAWSPVASMDMAAYLKLMQRNINSTDCTYHEMMSKNPMPVDQKLPKYAVFSQIMSPNYTRTLQRRDTAIAEVRGSQVFLSLLAYKDRFGSYPAKLSDLKKLGWKLDTEDVFSGKSFKYQRRNKGFMLYSIGSNLKDDSGTANPKSIIGGPGPDDLVWTMDR